MHLPTSPDPINRRTFLRGTGITLALPFLEARPAHFHVERNNARARNDMKPALPYPRERRG